MEQLQLLAREPAGHEDGDAGDVAARSGQALNQARARTGSPTPVMRIGIVAVAALIARLGAVLLAVIRSGFQATTSCATSASRSGSPPASAVVDDQVSPCDVAALAQLVETSIAFGCSGPTGRKSKTARR